MVAFLFGVMSLTFTCLLYGMAPTWLPFAYTAQSAFYLPTRIWQYKKKSYHYFLFGGYCSEHHSLRGWPSRTILIQLSPFSYEQSELSRSIALNLS
jgi:hypothetical protein